MNDSRRTRNAFAGGLQQMSENKYTRKQLFVDPKVQGTLVFRVVAYWVICVFTMALMLLCWRMLTGPARPPLTQLDDMWFHFGPALVASFILLPLVIYDILRTSNRFTGPMFRLRRCMRELAEGKEVKPIRFRGSDFWQDLAKDFNAVVQRVHDAETQQTRGREASQPQEAENAGKL
jgi:hypothetical protein